MPAAYFGFRQEPFCGWARAGNVPAAPRHNLANFTGLSVALRWGLFSRSSKAGPPVGSSWWC
jgi:hypothetical protein